MFEVLHSTHWLSFLKHNFIICVAQISCDLDVAVAIPGLLPKDRRGILIRLHCQLYLKLLNPLIFIR